MIAARVTICTLGMILVDLISSSMAFSYPEEALTWPPRLPVYLAEGNDGNVNEIMRHFVKITALWRIRGLSTGPSDFKILIKDASLTK